jgi:hypothetical protein
MSTIWSAASEVRRRAVLPHVNEVTEVVLGVGTVSARDRPEAVVPP